MEREAFLGLFEPNEFNDLYRKLYLRNPKAFEKPVKSWAEFCINYQKEEGGGDSSASAAHRYGVVFYGGGVFF